MNEKEIIGGKGAGGRGWVLKWEGGRVYNRAIYTGEEEEIKMEKRPMDAADLAESRLTKLREELDAAYCKLGRRCKRLGAMDMADTDIRLLLVYIESKEQALAAIRVCNRCGKALGEEDIFCKYCGQKWEETPKLRCPACGSVPRAAGRFCHRCGAELRPLLPQRDAYGR